MYGIDSTTLATGIRPIQDDKSQTASAIDELHSSIDRMCAIRRKLIERLEPVSVPTPMPADNCLDSPKESLCGVAQAIREATRFVNDNASEMEIALRALRI